MKCPWCKKEVALDEYIEHLETCPNYNAEEKKGNLHNNHLKAEIIDERTAQLNDKQKLRITPEGQKKVKELASVGDLVRTSSGRYMGIKGMSYDWEGRIISVSKHLVYGLPTYSICFVDIEKYGKKYRDYDYHYLSELVAQDNRILQLFVANKEEVFVKKFEQKGQLTITSFDTTKPRLGFD